AGSVHSQYSEDTARVPKERSLKNKFIALILEDERDAKYYLDRRPEIMAWSSVKYEWAKERAIYGTDITSYILAHYAFYNCEDTLPADFPVGKKARPSFVNARVAAVLEDTMPLCIDFEDFNSQHSIGAMKSVIRAYIDANKNRLEAEQLAAAEWTMLSMDNTVIIDNMGTKTTYRANGTLMSGWRLTTFMNSVLNYIYTRQIVGVIETRTRSIHNGDDVLMGVNNLEVARRAVQNSEKMGVRLQRKKCGFGGIAEFLRVDHMRGEYGQYLTRNIATLVHSRIESKIAIKAADLVQAMEDRLSEYLIRGGEVEIALNLRKNYYKRIAPKYDKTVEELHVIKHTHRVAGGISERTDAGVEHVIEETREAKEIELPESIPGIISYAAILKKKLELTVPVRVIEKRLRNATLNAVQMVFIRENISKNTDVQRYTVLRAIFKAYSDAAEDPLFGKAMLVGFVFDVLSKKASMRGLIRQLATSKQPLALLRVLA
ncbi:RNA-dependent RNA polymerase, partial [viral metagenome]